jgi:hypothetical protein
MREEFFPNVTADLCSCGTTTSDSRNITTLEAKSLAISDTLFNYEEKPRCVIGISEPTPRLLGHFFKR